MAIPLINGNAYSFVDIQINIGGNLIFGVDAISYKSTQEKTNNYGASRFPVSRGRGKKEFEASITLHMEEIERLADAAPNNDITDIPPFDIVVIFGSTNPGGIRTHILRNAEFMENPLEASEGDTKIASEVPLIIANIERTPI